MQTWQPTPESLVWIKGTLSKYSPLLTPDDVGRYLRSLSEDTLSIMAGAAERLRREELVYKAWEWIMACDPDPRSIVGYSHRLFHLLLLFQHIAERGVRPFPEFGPYVLDTDHFVKFNWELLPTELRFVAGPAARYGKHVSSVAQLKFLRNIADADLRALRTFAARIQEPRAWSALCEWLDRHPITEHPEVARIEALMEILDGLDLLDGADVDAHPVETGRRAADSAQSRQGPRGGEAGDVTPIDRRGALQPAWRYQLYCPEGLPDPTTELDQVVEGLCSRMFDPSYRAQCASLLLLQSADSGAEALNRCGTLASCAARLCDNLIMAGWCLGMALFFVYGWNIGGYGPGADKLRVREFRSADDLAEGLAFVQRALAAGT